MGVGGSGDRGVEELGWGSLGPSLDQLSDRESRTDGSLRSPVSALLSRPPQDISLEEFDDEDLSEITDDCGLGLSYDWTTAEGGGEGCAENSLTGEPHLAFAQRSLGEGLSSALRGSSQCPLSLGLLTCGPRYLTPLS